MSMDRNELPAGYSLPSEFEGKKILGIQQTTIQDGDAEPSFVCLCKDGSKVIIPLSGMNKAEAVAE